MERYEPAMSFDEDAARSYDEGLRGDEDAAVTFLRPFGFEVTREIPRTASGPQRWQLERPMT